MKSSLSEAFKFRITKSSYTSSRQQVEMKPLLDDHNGGSSEHSDGGHRSNIGKDDDVPNSSPRGSSTLQTFTAPAPHDQSIEYPDEYNKEQEDINNSPITWRRSRGNSRRWTNAKASAKIYYENLPS